MNLPREKHLMTVTLESGGQLQLTANFDLADLSEKDRLFVYAVCDMIQGYADSGPEAPLQSPGQSQERKPKTGAQGGKDS